MRTSQSPSELAARYRSRPENPASYAEALASVLGPHAVASAQTRQPYRPASLDLSDVAPILNRAATVAAHIIANNVATLNHATDRETFLTNRADALGATYTRELDLYESGHFDSIDCRIAGEVLQRAEAQFQRPEAANSTGLALLDMHLRDTVDAIKALLARQVSMLDEVPQ